MLGVHPDLHAPVPSLGSDALDPGVVDPWNLPLGTTETLIHLRQMLENPAKYGIDRVRMHTGTSDLFNTILIVG